MNKSSIIIIILINEITPSDGELPVFIFWHARRLQLVGQLVQLLRVSVVTPL